jgi:hypothetical protein
MPQSKHGLYVTWPPQLQLHPQSQPQPQPGVQSLPISHSRAIFPQGDWHGFCVPHGQGHGFGQSQPHGQLHPHGFEVPQGLLPGNMEGYWVELDHGSV